MVDIGDNTYREDAEINIMEKEATILRMKANLMDMRKRKLNFEKMLKELGRDLPIQETQIQEKEDELNQLKKELTNIK